MWLGFIRQKTILPQDRGIRDLEKTLDQTWDLSGAGIPGGNSTLAGRVFDLMSGKLNPTIRAILKSVVTLACLGPELFGISRSFKSKARIQSEKINEISGAGRRISLGIEDVSNHTHTLTQDFERIRIEVTSALEKGDQSMAGFREIKDQVAVLVETILILKENSDSIGSIIHVINTISEETNILSLNARIEAARGAADGKGFKVIAEEVGNLARQSKEATLDIQRRLTFLGEQIAKTVAAVDQVEGNVLDCERQIDGAGTALSHVCSRLGALSGNLAEINEATGRQAEDVRQVSESIMGIESSVGDQVLDADTIFDIAEQVNAACDQMILDTGVFHLSGHHKAKETAQAMADDPAIVSGCRADQEQSLKGYLGRESYIELAYITDRRGRQITSNIYSEKLVRHTGLEHGLDRDWAAKEWFLTPAKTLNPFISKVYRSSATQSFCFTVAVPLKDHRGFSGVLGIDINFQDMLDI